jgi:hypothetical protein
MATPQPPNVDTYLIIYVNGFLADTVVTHGYPLLFF